MAGQERKRDIHVVRNNTLVENPAILEYMKKQLELISYEAVKQSMIINIEHTIPVLNNTFRVNLVGCGYAALNTLFR